MTPLHLFSSPVEISLVNHLLQSTLFAGVAGLLTLVLKKNHARARYWLWLASSVKFLVPFSVLVDIGSRLGWSSAQPVIRRMTAIVEEIRLTGTPLVFNPGGPAALQPAHTIVPSLLVTLWVCGFIAVLFFWWRRWRRVTAVVRAAVSLTEGRECAALRRIQQKNIRLLSSNATLEPGIFGVFRPVLLLPAGIADRLDDAQLEAIVAHELCHVRRRDNLTAAIHMAIEAVFWFHPLVWWLGARLVDERERACDEEVLRLGNEPEVYAEGILKVCKFYVESPIVCMSGVTGANLKQRIERIMTHRIQRKLNLARKLLLAGAAAAAVAGPVAIGILSAPPVRGQSQPAKTERASFEVASIKTAAPGYDGSDVETKPGGRFFARNVTVRMLIRNSYGVRDFQIHGAPGWLEGERFDIAAKAADDADLKGGKLKLMIQALLADRFKLALHRETKELPVYALVAGKSGAKLRESAAETRMHLHGGRGQIDGEKVSMAFFATELASHLGRTVIEDTGLKGAYDLQLHWTPDDSQSADDPGPSIFTALQEQLGLKLESRKGPVEILVIDRVERVPTEN